MACLEEQRLAQSLPALAGATWGVGPQAPPEFPLTSSRGCWLALGEERWFCLLRLVPLPGWLRKACPSLPLLALGLPARAAALLDNSGHTGMWGSVEG